MLRCRVVTILRAAVILLGVVPTSCKSAYEPFCHEAGFVLTVPEQAHYCCSGECEIKSGLCHCT
jgi:hypothetical protein